MESSSKKFDEDLEVGHDNFLPRMYFKDKRKAAKSESVKKYKSTANL
ncbi:MAG: hypothetical protein RBS23_00180 [Mariniphaga sp.]|jgi:hypothetical protein|nr:hypothetical protein [Mariniphaga sp.]